MSSSLPSIHLPSGLPGNFHHSHFYPFQKGESAERDRLALQHEIYKPRVRQVFEKVLDEYGLAERLKAPKIEPERVRILDIGCGEGWFLFDLATRLAERGLLDGCDLVGIDVDFR